MSKPPLAAMSPAETARYTQEMLESLRRIAVQQRQGILAHLLELAAVEARHQAQDSDGDTGADESDQETALPG